MKYDDAVKALQKNVAVRARRAVWPEGSFLIALEGGTLKRKSKTAGAEPRSETYVPSDEERNAGDWDLLEVGQITPPTPPKGPAQAPAKAPETTQRQGWAGDDDVIEKRPQTQGQAGQEHIAPATTHPRKHS